MLARIRDVTFKQSTSSTKILQFTVSIWKLEYKGVLELQLFLKVHLFSHSEGRTELETTKSITRFIRWRVSNTRGHLTQR